MTKMSSATFLLSFWAVRYAEIGLMMYELTPESMYWLLLELFHERTSDVIASL